jgi:hypothetical protein
MLEKWPHGAPFGPFWPQCSDQIHPPSTTRTPFRTVSRRNSEVRYAPARWDTTAAGSAVTLKRASVSYVRADHEVLYSVHKKLIIPLTSRIILTLSLTKQALRRGDTLVVWRLDRLGRSLRHLIDTITDLGNRGVGFKSLQENIDTTTSGGKLVFHIFGALELPSIGWLLFLPDNSPNDWTASCPTVVTFATRLLTEALSKAA